MTCQWKKKKKGYSQLKGPDLTITSELRVLINVSSCIAHHGIAHADKRKQVVVILESVPQKHTVQRWAGGCRDGTATGAVCFAGQRNGVWGWLSMVYPMLLPQWCFCASVSEFSTRLACITFLIIESFEKSHPNKASQGGWKMTSKSLDSWVRDLKNKMACLQRKWVVSKAFQQLLLLFSWVLSNVRTSGLMEPSQPAPIIASLKKLESFLFISILFSKNGEIQC